MPVTTGLTIGMGWGLLAALLEGLPLLLQGSPWPHLGSRLLALAYLAVVYGALCALVGGLAGCFTLASLQVTRRFASRSTLAAAYTGGFTGMTVAVFWIHRFAPRTLGWVIILMLSAAVGSAVGWLLYRVAHRGAVSWRVLRGTVLVAFLLAVFAVLSGAGFRSLLRDLPLFNPSATEEVATSERPNIVLVTAAGLRADHLGIYGYDPEISPNIDALAARGLRFEQAFVQASWTEPSLASLLTSLYPSELGITCRALISCQPHLDNKRTTLAEALQNSGYYTQAYLTSPWLTADLGFDQGFDGFESVRAEEPFDLGPMSTRTLGRLLGCRQGSALCRLMAEGHSLLFNTPIPPGWGGDRVNTRVTRFLELHGEERFFLWVHYTEALPPYDLEPPFRPLPQDPLASPERRLKGMGYWELGDAFAVREGLSPLDVQGLTALYNGEVHRIDRLVGGLTGLLEAHGLADRTLFVLTSDHGQEFMEHGGYTYGHTLYDEVLHVPLILAGPGIASPGQAIGTPVGLLDLAPTLIEIAGASIPLEAEGRSLVPAMREQTLEERPIYSESLYRVPHELKALRLGGYKLIYNMDDGQFELYDLSTDPSEQQDRASQVTQVVEAMKDDLIDWMAHTAQIAHELTRATPPTEFSNATW